MAKKKPIMNAKAFNSIIKVMTIFQNNKNKLNAGEKREAADGAVRGLIAMSPTEKLHIFELLAKGLTTEEKLAVVHAVTHA